MADPAIKRRLVFHLGGYDLMPPETVHRRFLRELRRFEATWGATAEVSEPAVSEDEASWRVVTQGPDWRVETEYRLIRWDDVIAAATRRPQWRRLPLGLAAFADFLLGGALWGYLRTNWRYAGFFLYPYLILFGLGAAAALAGWLAAGLAGSTLAGVAAALAAFALLIRFPGRAFFLDHLLDDWIFARDYIRREHAVLGPRLEAAAGRLCAAARAGEADEILVVGHSLGAVLAIDLLDRALRRDPELGRGGARVVLLTVGSSALKIGLHRAATRFRAAVERVASSPAIFWGEYQALTDVMNFYKVDPVKAMRLQGASPAIRQVRVRAMLEPAAYRRIKRNFFRVHCQFVSGNDRRAPYDYFMLVCGPFAAEDQVRSRDGAASWLGPDGALAVLPAPEGAPAPEAARRSAAR